MTPLIDPSNEAQAGAWDGDEGKYWAAHHEQFEDCLAHYQPAFHAASRIRPGDRVLDVGCGTGGTTRQAARAAVGGEAWGIDLSGQMIEVARRIAAVEGLGNAHFEQADAQIRSFSPGEFDAVISRTGAMFFGDAEQAFANLGRALRPGGHLTLLTWQAAERNEWIGALAGALAGRMPPTQPPGTPGPLSLSEPVHVRVLLESTGFEDVELEGLSGPMTYGRDAGEAHTFVLGLLGWMLEGRPAEERTRAVERLDAVLEAHDGPDGVELGSAAWLVTARRAADAVDRPRHR